MIDLERAVPDLIFTDYTHGLGEVPHEDMPGIEAFIGEVRYPPMPVVVREWLEFADPERQRRWDALGEDERAAYIRVLKKRLRW